MEVNLIANWSSNRKRCDFYCLRCYNRREIDDTRETVKEVIQRRIKESGTRTTDLEGISVEKEVGKIESYFKQKI